MNLLKQTIQSFGLAFAAAWVPSPVWAASSAISEVSLDTFDPTSVLVFDPGVLDNFEVLGLEPGGVPRDNWTGALRKYASSKYLSIGSLFEPDYEVVNAARPALILIADRSRPRYAQLSKIAPTLDLTVEDRELLVDAENNALRVGRLFGKEALATQKVEALDQTISSLKARASNVGTALILLTSGGRVDAYGPGSRFGILHDSFGFKPAAPDLDIAVHGQPVSFEFIAKVMPDWLFVIDRDASIGEAGSAASKLLDNTLVRSTPAWKQGQVVYLDGDDWYMIGLTGIGSLQRTVDSLLARLEVSQPGVGR